MGAACCRDERIDYPLIVKDDALAMHKTKDRPCQNTSQAVVLRRFPVVYIPLQYHP